MSIRLTTLSLTLAVAACTPTVSPSAETSPTVTQSAIDTAYGRETLGPSMRLSKMVEMERILSSIPAP